jgi:hypothetical protein
MLGGHTLDADDFRKHNTTTPAAGIVGVGCIKSTPLEGVVVSILGNIIVVEDF